MFINHTFYIKKKKEGAPPEERTDLLDFFSWDQYSKARRLLLVAEQGSGKSTAIRRSTKNWCDHVQNPKMRNLLQMKYALKRLYEKYYQPPAWIFDSLRELLTWLRDRLAKPNCHRR